MRGLHAILALLAAVTAHLAAPRTADACSCGRDPHMYPPDGALDVPRNAQILAIDGVGLAVYVLSGPNGPVELEATPIIQQFAYRVDVLRPLAPLDPGATYELHDSYDTAYGSFTTAAGEDVTPPGAPVIETLALAQASLIDTISSSCGDDYFYVDFQVALDADTVGVDFTVTPGARYVVLRDRLAWPRPFSSFSDSCGIIVPLVPGDEYCFEVRALDQAGNASTPVTQCATVTRCADIEDPDTFDGDLSACDPPMPDLDGHGPPPDDAGCSTMPAAGALAPLLLALCAVRRRDRYARLIGRIFASRNSHGPQRYRRPRVS